MPENIGNINIIREVLDDGSSSGVAPTDSVGGLMGVNVSVESAGSPDELWQGWLELLNLVAIAADRADELSQRWTQSTDSLVREQLWVDYESAARTYRVLASWRDVFYAAYVFATDGAVYTDVAVSTAADLVPPPAPFSGPPQF